MGEVVEVGSANRKLKIGDPVVVPFTIFSGECFFCSAAVLRAASGQTRTARKRRSFGSHQLAFSAIRTSSADMRAARRSICRDGATRLLASRCG
jgi:D-arabinose 1-dehydrogenase-like Zn-dependent alcohol dehydrogenase